MEKKDDAQRGKRVGPRESEAGAGHTEEGMGGAAKVQESHAIKEPRIVESWGNFALILPIIPRLGFLGGFLGPYSNFE